MSELDSDAESLQALIDRSLPLRRDLVIRARALDGRHDRPLPEEILPVHRAGAGRRREFAAGRALAREALRELGLPEAPIPTGDDRGPVWPDGVTGSITHTRDLVVVALATDEGVASIGVDLEIADRVSGRVLHKILTPSERAGAGVDARLPALVFSAKEAGYKATRPLAGRFIGFQDAAVDVDWAAGCFRLRYLGEHPPSRVMEHANGWFLFCGPYVLSLVIIPRHH